MPPIDINNPEILKFLRETYEKTDKLRMRWNTLHQGKLKKAAEYQKAPKGLVDTDVTKFAMGQGMAAITRDFISSSRNRKTNRLDDTARVQGISSIKRDHTITSLGLGHPKDDPRLALPDSALVSEPLMRPVDPKHTEYIYEGIPVYGREYYLNIRKKIAPEKKYYFPETSGWEYGWRLYDSVLAKHSPKYGKTTLLTKGRMSRSGPQPDPEHYNPPVKAGLDKCIL